MFIIWKNRTAIRRSGRRALPERLDPMRLGWHLRRYERKIRDLIGFLRPGIVQGMWVPTDGYLAARAGCRPLVIATFVTDVVRKPNVSRRLHDRIGWTLKQADRVIVDCPWVRRGSSKPTPPFQARDSVCFRAGSISSVSILMFLTQVGRGSSVIFCNRAFEDVYDHETLFRRGFHECRNAVHARARRNRNPPVLIRAKDGRVGLEGAVRYLGGIGPAEMAERLRAADVYVSCSRQDGTSVSLLEALASGLPCVVSDLPTNAEWVSGENGFRFSPGDAKALAEALSKLLADQTLRRKCGLASRRIAEERADWSIHRLTLLRAYEELLG